MAALPLDPTTRERIEVPLDATAMVARSITGTRKPCQRASVKMALEEDLENYERVVYQFNYCCLKSNPKT